MKFSCYEDIVQITPFWKGERLPDGRPKVSDDILSRMKKITLEEAWGPLWGKGYRYQFEGDFKIIGKDNTLVGRAVTAVMVPYRPDLHETLLNYGYEKEGRRGFFNQWVIDSLIEDDVVVVDLFDKIFQGTFVGGNLSTAISTRTKRGGSVIWGGVRDVEQIMNIDSIKTYYRGNDPTGIGDVTLIGFNGACRIGKAICLPGDVVLGTNSGVLFIPPHLAEECVIDAEKSHIRDVWGFLRLAEKRFSTAQIDSAWSVPMWEDFIDWLKEAPEAEEYRHLNWDKEIQEAKEKQDNQSRGEIRL